MDGSLLDVRQLSRLLNVSRETLYREVRAGRIPGTKVGNQWRFSGPEVTAWFQGRRAEAPAAHAPAGGGCAPTGAPAPGVLREP